MQADHEENFDAPPADAVEHDPPWGPGDPTWDENQDRRIRERSVSGPQDFMFSVGEIVNVAIPYENKQVRLVEGTIIDETLNFYTVRYCDPRPDRNIAGQKFCDRRVRKDDEITLSKHVHSQSHTGQGPDKTYYNPYTVRRDARHYARH